MKIKPNQVTKDTMNCVSCNDELDELDNILGLFCDPVCAEKGDECPLCDKVPHQCKCEDDLLMIYPNFDKIL